MPKPPHLDTARLHWNASEESDLAARLEPICERYPSSNAENVERLLRLLHFRIGCSSYILHSLMEVWSGCPDNDPWGAIPILSCEIEHLFINLRATVGAVCLLVGAALDTADTETPAQCLRIPTLTRELRQAFRDCVPRGDYHWDFILSLRNGAVHGSGVPDKYPITVGIEGTVITWWIPDHRGQPVDLRESCQQCVLAVRHLVERIIATLSGVLG